MKKILVASDSFKGTMTSEEIGKKIKEGMKEIAIVDYISISDGGEGFAESIYLNSKTAIKKRISTLDDMLKPIEIDIIILNKEAYFDVASIVGLYNYKTISAIKKSSKGIGITINKIYNELNITKINIGLGGTSTSLLGWDMLQEIGITFLDKENNKIKNPKEYTRIYKIDNQFNKEIDITIFSDVKTKLIENQGFIKYASQKFVTEEEKLFLKSFANKIISVQENSNYEKEGTGAAGGLGYAFYNFCSAKIINGIEKIIEITNLHNLSKQYDILITGEGKFDNQTQEGKAPLIIRKSSNAKKNILIAGIVEDIVFASNNFDSYYQLKKPDQTIHEAINKTQHNLQEVIKSIIEGEIYEKNNSN